MTETTDELYRLVYQAQKDRHCAECGADLNFRLRPRSAYCSEEHRYAFRARRRRAARAEANEEKPVAPASKPLFHIAGDDRQEGARP